jgi:hypothetical protein
MMDIGDGWQNPWNHWETALFQRFPASTIRAAIAPDAAIFGYFRLK